MRNNRSTSRRDFLRYCVGGAVGLSCNFDTSNLVPAKTVSKLGTSRVSISRDPQLRDSSASTIVDPQRIRGLLDRAMQALFESSSPIDPWTRVVRPGQRVGLKVNSLGGRGLSSNVQLVEAICVRLQDAGIKAHDIVIWDRDSAELERAGFRLRAGGTQIQCFGTDRVGFEPELASFGSVGSQLSRILTERCDVLINVPILKDHDGAGVSISLKNMYGVINNPNKYHPNGCDPYVADVNMLPEIRSRLRLHICDATTASFEGGPGFKPQFTWKANTLLVSEDPVALDKIGWEMIEQKREERGLKRLELEGRAPHYIATAADADHRLGNNDLRHIAVVDSRVA
jgi:uncharacterized protein (DUF362 family)